MVRKYLFFALILLVSGCKPATDNPQSGARDAPEQSKSNDDSSHDFSIQLVSTETPEYFRCTSDAKDKQFEYDGPILSRFQNGTFTVFTHYSRLDFELKTSVHRSQNTFPVKSLDVTPFHPFLFFNDHDTVLIEENISSGLSFSKGAGNSDIIVETATDILECKNVDKQVTEKKADRLDAFFKAVSEDAEAMRQRDTFAFQGEQWWTVAYVLGVQSGACSEIADRNIDVAKENYDLAYEEYVRSVKQIDRLGCFSKSALEKIASKNTINDNSDCAVDMVNELTDLQPYRPKIVSIFKG